VLPIPGQDPVKLRVVLDETLGVGLSQPADSGVGIGPSQGPNHGRREDNVPSCREANQEDGSRRFR